MGSQATRYSSTSDERIRTELRATLATYHELGPDYEQQIVDSFLERLGPIVNTRALPPDNRRSGRRGRRQRRRFLGLAAVVVLGWWLVAGHAFGGAHRAYRVYPGFGGTASSPYEVPAIPPAPAPPPAPPQPPRPPVPPSIQ